jgi:hypothetical protein
MEIRDKEIRNLDLQSLVSYKNGHGPVWKEKGGRVNRMLSCLL